MTGKLLIFDLDGTLAPVGKGIDDKTIRAMRTLENRGFTIVICSGKPIYYLCGLMRQVELQNPILLGENGAAMQIGVALPPKEHYILPYSQKAKDSIERVRKELEQKLPHLWYQPNQVGLTPFFDNQRDNEEIGKIIREVNPEDVDIYPQADCYDITPKGISKGEAIRALGRYLDVPVKAMIAVGDGINDYPMFACAGYSIGIHLPDASITDRNVPDIDAAMAWLLEQSGAEA